MFSQQTPLAKICYRFLLIILFYLPAILGFSQQYFGWTKENAIVRWGPTTSARIVTTLEPGRQIFMDSLLTKNDYCYIIDIGTNNEGYVLKDLVLSGQPVEVPEGEVFADKLFVPVSPGSSQLKRKPTIPQ